MSEASSQAQIASATVGGPSFTTALFGFVSSMMAGAAILVLIVAL
jgi:hypothetical protein